MGYHSIKWTTTARAMESDAKRTMAAAGDLSARRANPTPSTVGQRNSALKSATHRVIRECDTKLKQTMTVLKY